MEAQNDNTQRPVTKKFYSVRDGKSETYFLPYPARNAGEALRSFQNEIRRGDGIIGTYPEDCAYGS